ncbi:MAG: hypothetical protein D4R84_13045 [Rhodocyclaceae bacterium]|nr:MAG: hypothetical protein D4R84_13045 [Rhodocyclaceae bacterium]
MLLTTFLNILGACVGFLSAIFFSIGAMIMTPMNIHKIAASYWDANQHWGDCISEQRADYIAGGLLLLLSFLLQLSANLVQPTAEPYLIEPLGCAVAEIATAVSFLLICSLLLRNAVAKNTKQQVRQLQMEELAAQELATKNHTA